MDRIAQVIDDVINAEKGYVNNPNDRGGETNFGITIAVARSNGYTGSMRAMPRSVAVAIYRHKYVVEPGFDHVLSVHAGIGAELVDTGVNMGPQRAGMFLQRWLNGLNSARKYGTLLVDGRVGPGTVSALRAFLQWRGAAGATTLLRGLNAAQAMRYLEIAEGNPSQKEFLYGWVSNRVVI